MAYTFDVVEHRSTVHTSEVPDVSNLYSAASCAIDFIVEAHHLLTGEQLKCHPLVCVSIQTRYQGFLEATIEVTLLSCRHRDIGFFRIQLRYFPLVGSWCVMDMNEQYHDLQFRNSGVVATPADVSRQTTTLNDYRDQMWRMFMHKEFEDR